MGPLIALGAAIVGAVVGKGIAEAVSASPKASTQSRQSSRDTTVRPQSYVVTAVEGGGGSQATAMSAVEAVRKFVV